MLRQTKGWFINRHGYIRTLNSNGNEVCPVCAVANLLIEKEEYDINAWEAAPRIRLPVGFAHMIQVGADDHMAQGATPKVYNFLLKRLGLCRFS